MVAHRRDGAHGQTRGVHRRRQGFMVQKRQHAMLYRALADQVDHGNRASLARSRSIAAPTRSWLVVAIVLPAYSSVEEYSRSLTLKRYFAVTNSLDATQVPDPTGEIGVVFDLAVKARIRGNHRMLLLHGEREIEAIVYRVIEINSEA